MGNIYKEYTPPASAGGKYLKLEDGVTYRLRLISEPVVFDSIFDEGGPKEAISTKYAWVVWNVEEDVAQVLQLPVTGYRGVAAIGADDDYGDPAENTYDIKVTRTGTGKETKYTVLAGPAKGEPSEETEQELKDFDLIEAVGASPSAQRIQWLRDALSGKPAPEKAPAKATAKPKKDVVIEDVGDEPINLDDIPF